VLKIGDLVTIPPVRTVIRLADLSDSSLRRHLVETFILTGEVTLAISTILGKIADLKGEGFFVIGNYGSGKSHLLNILSLTINDFEARRQLSASCRDGNTKEATLPGLLNKAAVVNPLIVEVSLVEYSNRENLEQIVLKELVARLHTGGGTKTEIPANIEELPRREAFREVKQELERQNRGGLLLLIDELSEFLRSKENPGAYNEDIRFLQYLGEFAEAIPAWIVATMQENIENTGSLSGELLHKIKDRYPVRFHLSGEHVKEIVSGRLIKRKPAAETALYTVFDELQAAFTNLPFSKENFTALYPVHPATVDMLDELRPLFSQHRGVIDFIHFRLAGDPGRGIEPLIEQPALELLTPDFIFDHFRDRLRETMETNPYSEQVFHHYEREAERLFEDSDDRIIALRLLKLLILGAIARAPQSFSSADLAKLLLYRYSSLESSINFDYINEITEKLLTHGAYLTSSEENSTIYYTIDLKADVGILLEKKLERIKRDLEPGDSRILENLLPWANESYLPLKDLQQQPERKSEVTWQNTKRTGEVYFRSPADPDKDDLAAIDARLVDGETDFIFFMAPPSYTSTPNSSLTIWKTLFEKSSNILHQCLALWMPRDINAAEEETLRNAYAYQMLADEYSADDSPVGRQVKRQLNILLNEEKTKVKELFRNIYLQGRLKAAGQMPSPSSFGYLPFSEILNRTAAEILKTRYPRHSEIHPLSEQASSSLMQRTLDLLFSTELEAEGLERGTRQVIEHYIAPLGLVKKKGQGFQLVIDPKNSPLTTELFRLIPEDGRIALTEVYKSLRKGPFGLSSTGFQVLGMAAILSGALSAFQGGKRLSPSQVNYFRFWNINELGPGTLIRPELQKVLAEVPFLPARLRSGPITFTAQQQTWETVIAFKVDWTNRAAELRHRIRKVREHPFFSTVNWDNTLKTLERFQTFLNEIKTSYASRDGLERFLAACQSSPLLASDWQRLNALDSFFSNDLPEVLRIATYLRDPSLVLPTGDRFTELHRRYRLLAELIEEEALLFEEKYRERLKREFTQFRNDYTELYLVKHKEAVGPGRIKPYRVLIETGAYRLLEQLGKINALVVENDLVGINRLLGQALEKECNAADEIRLSEYASCSCGYNINEKVDYPDRNKIEDKILLGLRAYIEALQSEETKKKLASHADHLELIGRRREAKPLRALLLIDSSLPAEQLVALLDDTVSSATIALINQALTGGAIITDRSLEELQNLLAGRVFNLTQLTELIQGWINKGEAKPPSYIRITGIEPSSAEKIGVKNDEVAEKGIGAKEFLETKQPRLLGAAAKTGVEKLFALAMLSSWIDQFVTDGSGQTQFEKLADDSLGEAARDNNILIALANLGEALVADKHELCPSLLIKTAETANLIIPAAELIELYLKASGDAAHRFETMLDLLVDEPFFPTLSREVAARLAVRITAEESVPQLSIITGMLREALKSSIREPNGLTETHLNEKKTALQVLKTATESSLILHETEVIASSPPENDKNWERFYYLLSPFELALGKLEETGARSLLPEVSIKRWRRLYSSLLEPLQKAFSAQLCEVAPARRQTLRNLLHKMPEWIEKESNSAGAYLIIIDGARLDCWSELIDNALANYRFETIREGLLWAEQPTVTDTQLQPLKDEGLLGHMLNMNENLLAELVADPAAFLSAVNNARQNQDRNLELKAIKYNFIDEKIHSSKDPLPQLFEELALISRKQLHPLLEYLPSGALVLIAADHGFRTNLYHNKQNKEEPLYLHGSDTFFETLTPWAMLRKR